MSRERRCSTHPAVTRKVVQLDRKGVQRISSLDDLLEQRVFRQNAIGDKARFEAIEILERRP